MGQRTLVIATGHALSLALAERGDVLSSHHRAIGLGHAEALMPALRALLAPFGGSAAGIGHIIVETGPGSFTGLRIGHAAASALALAWRTTLAGVRSTLLVAAAHPDAARHGRLGVALGAPRGQLWVERFALPNLASIDPPQAISVAQFPDWLGGDACIEAEVPRAETAIGLAAQLFSPAVPLYVRQQDDARSA